MQQHTGQHLLSAVLEELFKIRTVSVHLGAESSTIDVDAPSLTPEHMERAEERCAEVIAQARPVQITFEEASEQSGTPQSLDAYRHAADRHHRGYRPQRLRRDTCRYNSGNRDDTHWQNGEDSRNHSPRVRLRKASASRARADYRLLASIGRALSVPPEQSPELLAGLIEKNKSLEKTAQRLATELARREGKELYDETAPGPDGIRRTTQRGPIDDAMRARAQAFVAGEKAMFLAVCDQPPSLLLAASADSGIHAGERIKAAVTASRGPRRGESAAGAGERSGFRGSRPRGGFATLKLMLEGFYA